MGEDILHMDKHVDMGTIFNSLHVSILAASTIVQFAKRIGKTSLGQELSSDSLLEYSPHTNRSSTTPLPHLVRS